MINIAFQLDDQTLASLRLIASRSGETLEELLARELALLAANDEGVSSVHMAQIAESIDDPNPNIPHEKVMADMLAKYGVSRSD